MDKRLEAFEVACPKALTYCAEFTVDSQSSDPHFAGPIDVRVEPKRIGFRWHGCKDWTWTEYHELIFLSGDCSKTFRECVADLKEQAQEEGLRAGIEEAMKPPEERKPTVTRFILVPEQALTQTR